MENRVIKIKVLRYDTKEIVGWERINDDGHWEHIRPNRDTWLLGAITDDQEYSKFIRIEFTGLLDRFGVEIYEGDIVKDGYYGTCMVLWSGGWSIKHISGGVKYYNYSQRIPNKTSQTFEVIGNIHENPELLTK